MCFSPEASFATAAFTGAIGVLALNRARGPRDVLLAATPLLFALQQALEGFIWLAAAGAQGQPMSSPLVLGYLIFARAFWPAYAPLAVMIVEPRRQRLRLMAPLLVVGAGVSAYLSWGLATLPYSAQVVGGHMIYRTQTGEALAVAVGYLAATTAPLLMSSHGVIRLLGLAVSIGCVVAYSFYWAAFQSVWCLFAAAASAVILLHFERRRRVVRQPAAGCA